MWLKANPTQKQLVEQWCVAEKYVQILNKRLVITILNIDNNVYGPIVAGSSDGAINNTIYAFILHKMLHIANLFVLTNQ